MTKRFCILLTAILTAAVFLCAGTLIASETKAPTGDVTIQNKDYPKDKKGPVLFSHTKHKDDACTDCHHEYKEAGNNVWKEGMAVKKCSECHKAEGDTEMHGMKVMKLQNAYHRNCKNCHKEKKKGPFKKCNDCHAKK